MFDDTDSTGAGNSFSASSGRAFLHNWEIVEYNFSEKCKFSQNMLTKPLTARDIWKRLRNFNRQELKVRFKYRAFLLCLAMLLSAQMLVGQSFFRSITGTVQDPSGAVIPVGSVTLSNAGKITHLSNAGSGALGGESERIIELHGRLQF